MISGARAMVECLTMEGVDLVFGYPGAAIAPFYDSLSRSQIRHILSRGEQGAGHAANGYARISGRPGVCIATSGPGATNLFTAIATAYSDSIPLIAITGQVSTSSLGRDVFQEVDTTGAVEPYTKYSYLVRSVSDIPRVFKEAFHIASTGRQGPVLIDVPVDVQIAELDFLYPENAVIRGYKPRYDGHPLQIRKVAQALRSSKRPLICAGGGVLSSGASGLVQRLCEEGNIPLISTMMGISALNPEHPLYFGIPGQIGKGTANEALKESDLIIIIGARVGDRAIENPSNLSSHAVIVHIDIDSAEIGKNVGTSIPLVGDAARVVTQLLSEDMRGDRTAWLTYLRSLRSKALELKPLRVSKSGYADPNAIVRNICSYLKKGDVYIADVGLNQIWSSKNFNGEARFLTTGGMGTMGYSIPAALGAKLASPGGVVVAVCGDGAFQMSLAEMATAIQHNIPVKIVVMRNSMLGMIKNIQRERFGGNSFACQLTGSPDLELISKAYGFVYSLVDDSTDCETVFEAVFNSDAPCLVECVCDPEEEA